jgi:predicted Zn-dependent protease
VIGRAALVVAAVAIGAWLLSAYGGALDESRAGDLRPAADGSLTRADAARAAALYDAARRRRPDGSVVPRRAAQLARLGRVEQAAAELRALVRAEPENVTAWATLALVLARSDPAGARAADARRRALAPNP